MSSIFDADFRAWQAKRKAERAELRRQTAGVFKPRGGGTPVIRLAILGAGYVPMPRVWLYGPKWQRVFHVQHLRIADVAPESADLHRKNATRWFYDFTDDVRELVCEPIRHDVYAMWADPWERWRA